MADVTRPTVLYIAGSGRSGSTLLERLLGTLPGFVNVGELVDMFRRVVKYDERCGCGENFSGCDFWAEVGERAFGGWSQDLATEAVALQRQVARQRHLGHLMAPSVAPKSFQKARARYADIYARIYAAVLEVSGAEVVVDASKGASHALAISEGSRVDMRMVHLVRDARGVAFSWGKAGVERPHGGSRATMSSFSPQLTAFRWTVLQAEIAAVRRFVAGSALVRYEDLVTDPSRELARALAQV